MTPRNEPMSMEEFEAWADRISLDSGQRDYVWYVIRREYRRGRYGLDDPPSDADVTRETPDNAR